MSRQWMASLPAANRTVSGKPAIEIRSIRCWNASYRHERSPFVGTEGVDARPNLFAALALPAPVGVFLHFTQPRHQTRAADRERISAALRPEAAEQMKGRGFAQVKEFPDRLAVDAIGGVRFEPPRSFPECAESRRDSGSWRFSGHPLCQ